MRVYLMQHARPVPKEENPAQPLSPQGVGDAEAMGSRLAAAGVCPDVLFHSPKERAKETARIVREKLGGSGRMVERDDLAPLADPGSVLADLEAASGECLVVGHLPHLARLATRLLTGGLRDEPPLVKFEQGAVLCLVRDGEVWKVAWMLTPQWAAKA
ncbi:phosphohistidine phosphatase, SixA [Desulfacinum hydrothermale DSM 13146]|uniref:Phosphohistidine phosphatase, SixA n=1 Tax=Desulfacinum hydrothermale DSM 13146 TaxID=1121390 RepID=A0A1W1XN87_9BACT|nr:phosphohistidine phosphatase SixA [Desulfacinum hydrothermale]SMC24971.1 phosphohistidine phosphatase, SixA [Desulfacinum hydrothermale DSM 13146]